MLDKVVSNLRNNLTELVLLEGTNSFSASIALFQSTRSRGQIVTAGKGILETL